MKKLASKPRKPARRKRSARGTDLSFRDLDMTALRRLLAEDLPPDDDLADMIADLLSADLDDTHKIPDAEALSELNEALNQARLHAAGGDIEARQTLKNIRSMIDEAAARDAIHPATLMVLGRLLAGVQVEIGEPARAALGRALDLGACEGGAADAYETLLRPALFESASDPFELYEEVEALISIFPVAYRSAFVERMASDSHARLRRSAVGFLLHRDEATAEAAIRGPGAASGGLDDERRRWIEAIRPWLAPARRSALDAGLPGAPGAAPRPGAKIVKTIASVCDGSGVSFLLATVKSGSRFLLASVMIKPTGVNDCMSYKDLSPNEATMLERALRSSAQSSEISFAAWEKLLRLALGRNLSCDEPPPFALVGVVEALGLDSVAPDFATPAEIIASALADVVDRDHAETIRAAHEFAAKTALTDNWFEAGEEVEAVLSAARSASAGARALIESYLPGRREFWVAQCARSALALKDGARPRGETWKHLALVGRDLADGMPLSRIPLIRRIAETSARAYSLQKGQRSAAA
ncbi:MAG TPA: hypothetical protein VLI91_03130 [Roseiarcus sp.]|nr:hypothetical protein [Roseiarcus sp.]